jgi:phenylpyruvate tautomerase PptA (4-oxalocrotonate tautomerase family)
MDFRQGLGYASPMPGRRPLEPVIASTRPTVRAIASLACAFALTLAAASASAQRSFSFSQPDEAAAQEQQARAQRVAELVSTPCRAALKDRKIMVVIGEVQSNGYVAAEQQNYGPHFQAINQRLRALGLKTWTPEEIRRQVAQAEIDAYFRNDPDAALAASKRLGANFVLRGLISSQAAPNPVMAVNQVTVTMGFTLSEASGKVISNAEARGASYAGSDVPGMALTLVNEEADLVVARLYADYCNNAGIDPTSRPRPARK